MKKWEREWVESAKLFFVYDQDGLLVLSTPEIRFADAVVRRANEIVEENIWLRVAVQEMDRFSGLLYWIERERSQWWAEATEGSGIATTNAYRQTLEIALAKRSKK